jgi:hypothetical protein
MATLAYWKIHQENTDPPNPGGNSGNNFHD